MASKKHRPDHNVIGVVEPVTDKRQPRDVSVDPETSETPAPDAQADSEQEEPEIPLAMKLRLLAALVEEVGNAASDPRALLEALLPAPRNGQASVGDVAKYCYLLAGLLSKGALLLENPQAFIIELAQAIERKS